MTGRVDTRRRTSTRCTVCSWTGVETKARLCPRCGADTKYRVRAPSQPAEVRLAVRRAWATRWRRAMGVPARMRAVPKVRQRRLWSHDDDDRGLRRLLLALGLGEPRLVEHHRDITALRWHRAGAAKTPVLCAVVQLPSTWAQLEVAEGRQG